MDKSFPPGLSTSQYLLQVNNLKVVFYSLRRAQRHPVGPQGLSGSGGRFLVPTGLSATNRCHSSGAVPTGNKRAFSEQFSWDGKSELRETPRHVCVDKGHSLKPLELHALTSASGFLEIAEGRCWVTLRMSDE
ncbi:hypothetical protein HispidOSU_031069 [Sigmodon hispidus]